LSSAKDADAAYDEESLPYDELDELDDSHPEPPLEWLAPTLDPLSEPPSRGTARLSSSAQAACVPSALRNAPRTIAF
jgi:hypothetical protein